MEQKWINNFKPMDSEEDGRNTKKAGIRIKIIVDSTSKQKSPKKSKVIKEQESAEIDWESQNLGSADMEDIHVYKIIRADGNTSYHKTFSSMLRKFDRQDLIDLHKLVMKRFEDNTPEGYNFSLIADGWYFDMLQHVSRERYPLIKKMLKKMLNWKLEAEAESIMAFKLLKFIKS
ncbi:hypothetical protein Tco_1350538 [Tanacetum coccineum]